MPNNVLYVNGEIFSVVVGTLVLLAAALALAVRHRAHVGPGTSGHRPAEEEGESEVIGPDGYIDTFANTIEEAGGSLPLMAWIVILATLAAYFGYLILFWQPR